MKSSSCALCLNDVEKKAYIRAVAEYPALESEEIVAASLNNPSYAATSMSAPSPINITLKEYHRAAGAVRRVRMRTNWERTADIW